MIYIIIIVHIITVFVVFLIKRMNPWWAEETFCKNIKILLTPNVGLVMYNSDSSSFLRILMMCRWSDVWHTHTHTHTSRAIAGDEWNQRWAFAWSHNTHHSRLMASCRYRKWHVQSETTHNHFLSQNTAASHSESWKINHK